MTTGSEQALRAGDALLVVDVQHDFLPGGALGIAAGDRVIAPLNACIDAFVRAGLPVLATRDWHPADHCSFRARGGPWPVHCVAGTHGAAFTPGLRLPAGTFIVSKAHERDREAYSSFAGTGMEAELRRLGVRRLVIGGLATDYCVRHTALDARRLGFAVVVLRDAIAAVDARPGDGLGALQAMRDAGVVLAESSELLRPPGLDRPAR
jgi:nicotinamidase/pyrazinamidase